MSGALHKLSARLVETASKPKRYGDGGGLYLSVNSKTSKRWVFLFRWRGKLTEMGLGSAIPGSPRHRSLAAARQEAAEMRNLLAANINPLEAARATDAFPKAVPTFGEFADEYISTMARGMESEKHKAQWQMTLGTKDIDLSRVAKNALRATEEHRKVLQAIRAKPVDQVDTDDILRLLKPIWTIKPETANRTRGRVENVIDAAKAAGKRSGENPARWRGHLDKLLPKRSKLSRGHHAAMPYEEVPAFIASLHTRQAVAARALEFTILTAARTEETIGATWKEVDLRKRLWVVPKRADEGPQRASRSALSARLRDIARTRALRARPGQPAFPQPGRGSTVRDGYDDGVEARQGGRNRPRFPVFLSRLGRR